MSEINDSAILYTLTRNSRAGNLNIKEPGLKPDVVLETSQNKFSPFHYKAVLWRLNDTTIFRFSFNCLSYNLTCGSGNPIDYVNQFENVNRL